MIEPPSSDIVKTFIVAAIAERTDELRALVQQHGELLQEKLSSTDFFYIIHDEVDNRVASLEVVNIVYQVMTENEQNEDRTNVLKAALYCFVEGHNAEYTRRYQKLAAGEEESSEEDQSYEVFDWGEDEEANDDREFYQRIIELGGAPVYQFLFDKLIIPYAIYNEAADNFGWDSFNCAFAALVKKHNFAEAQYCLSTIFDLQLKLQTHCDASNGDDVTTFNKDLFYEVAGSNLFAMVLEENAIALFHYCWDQHPCQKVIVNHVLLQALIYDRFPLCEQILEPIKDDPEAKLRLYRYCIETCLKGSTVSEGHLRVFNTFRMHLTDNDKFRILGIEGALKAAYKETLPLFCLLWEMLSDSQRAKYTFVSAPTIGLGKRKFSSEFFQNEPTPLKPPATAVAAAPPPPITQPNEGMGNNRPY